MLSNVKSISLQGLDGFLINVQVDISSGFPSFDIVGLPDASIKEAKERVKSAIKNSGIDFFSRKVVVNLAPANTKKEGSFLDLPIAIGILIATGNITSNISQNIAFVGELSLDGSINKITGILPMCIEAKKLGIKTIIVPKANEKEASLVNEIEVIAISNLNEIIQYLNKTIEIKPSLIDLEKIFKQTNILNIDFSDVKGQENIKRALEISASGGHNCLLVGTPGCGKTMMARRIPTILPDLTFDEALEITKIHSIAGILKSNTALITKRPFRSPHHTISPASLIGGGKIPKPGEISLAHYGVLFLDELPEFNKNTLEVLRGPLEDREVTISRVNATLTYPCNFMLIAALNPCPCGYFGSKEKECKCSEQAIQKYMAKISGPLLDRIDIQIQVNSVKYDKLQNESKTETSEQIKKRVNNARKIQQERYKKLNIYSNSELTPKLIEKYCVLDAECKKLIQSVFDTLGLSARAYSKILKIARTIADLDYKENIEKKHLAEAIQYRSLDRRYLGK